MLVTTGIAGLDEILGGGFTRPSVVLVGGIAGTGKTTFVVQSIFNAAKYKDEVCLLMPAVGEPIAMINNFMSQFTFYNPDLYEERKIHYLDISKLSLKDTPEEIIDSIREKIETVKPNRVVIDPVTTLGYRFDEAKRREFFYNLFTEMKGWNALVLVTGEFTPEDLPKSLVSYMVDGIIYLSEEADMLKTQRYLTVKKMRGQKYLSGKHSFEITEEGIVVFPRIRAREKPEAIEKGRCSTGIKGLDDMILGGLLRGSSTVVHGPPGVGKSVLCTHFIVEGAKNKEPGIIITFDERPDEIYARAEGFGWDLKSFSEKNLLRIIYTLPPEVNMDELYTKIEKTIKEIGAKRLVIDSINGIQMAFGDTPSFSRYVNSLITLFKTKGITSILTNETREIAGSLMLDSRAPFMMDTTILMRYVEIESGIKKAISVLRMRNSDHDKEIREYIISDRGIEIRLPFTKYESVLSGTPRKSVEEKITEAFKWK
jgi:circadian clock protein KaiC